MNFKRFSGNRKTSFEPLGFADLERERADFDACVQTMSDIDHFCSSSAWVLAARESFHRWSVPASFRMKGGYLAMFQEKTPGWGRIWLPLEAAWCLSCPLIGDEAEMASQLPDLLLEQQHEWDTVILTGLPFRGRQWDLLAGSLGVYFQLFKGPRVTRLTASLDDGVDGFLSRRSAKFRSNLRRSLRLAKDEGLAWRHFTPRTREQAMELFDIIMNIEARSWKGISGMGVDQGDMRTFYHRMVEFLAADCSCRITLAERDGVPMGFILGGVMNDVYRGLQFSFDSEMSRLSLGNLLQLKMIERLSLEGCKTYDLGTEIDYKKRWSENAMSTHALIVKK